MTYLRQGIVRFLALALGAVLAAAVPASAQTIVEFSGLALPPQGITAGPDGNLWFTENSFDTTPRIGRLTVSGTLLETTDLGFGPFDIVAGPDGNLWFTDPDANTIGRVTPSGPTITQFPIPTMSGTPNGIASGFDGRLWFTERNASKIGRITTDGATIDEFPVPSGLQPVLMTRGPDGALWFTEGRFVAGRRVPEPIPFQIGRIDTTGAITEFPALGAGAAPFGIATGSDGALWFTDSSINSSIGRITTAGVVTQFPLTAGSNPGFITAGPDGALWFTEQSANKIGRITTAGALTEFPLASLGSLPLGITVGPNNAIWFTESGVQQIGTFQTAVLTVARAGSAGGSGLVTSDVPLGGAIQCTPAIGNCSVTYMTGLPITLTASAGPGTIFTGWSGGVCSGTAPCTVTLGGNTTVTANFDIQTFPLTVALTGDGSGSVTSTPAAIDCGAVCSSNFNSGTPVTLTANPAPGSSFIGWGGACSGTAPCSLTISGPTTVTADFTQFPVLTVSESGNGTVTSSPSGINCGPGASQCSAGFAPGTPVTLTAAPDAGATFAGWAGGGCSGTGPCTMTLTAPTAVSATFVTPGAAILTVSESGDGTVTSSPAGINCGTGASQCSAGFPLGQGVSLIATPGAGAAFAGWGGACSGTGGCALTLTSSTAVTASFTTLPPPTSTLSIALAGTGSGTVSSNPSGISCGGTCSASFQTGTQIVISAAAASSTFAGWSGGGCAGVLPCVVTLGANTTVTANFVANSLGNVSLLASILPNSRSVQVGNTANTFATIINNGNDTARTCTIVPARSEPADYAFHTTDPATNATIGPRNGAADIPAGGLQSYVLAFTPNAPFGPHEIPLVYSCANGPSPAPSIVGLNTLNLSASPVPVPDIVAVLASTDPGYVIITPTTNTGVFAVAATNVGITDTITANVDSGTANLPVTFTICQADFASRACVAAPTATVTLPIGAHGTAGFGIFLRASALVPDMPATNRAFVRFTDSAGTLRGSTSVAVRTGGGGGGGGDGGTASADRVSSSSAANR